MAEELESAEAAEPKLVSTTEPIEGLWVIGVPAAGVALWLAWTWITAGMVSEGVMLLVVAVVVGGVVLFGDRKRIEWISDEGEEVAQLRLRGFADLHEGGAALSRGDALLRIDRGRDLVEKHLLLRWPGVVVFTTLAVFYLASSFWQMRELDDPPLWLYGVLLLPFAGFVHSARWFLKRHQDGKELLAALDAQFEEVSEREISPTSAPSLPDALVEPPPSAN